MESLRAAGSSTAPESGRCRPARDDPRETWKALELGARVGGLVAPRCGAMGAGGGGEGVARVVGCSGMP